MNLHVRLIKSTACICLGFVLWCYACRKTEASSLPATLKEVQVGQIGSLREMKTILAVLQSGCLDARKYNRFTFELQKQVLAAAGEFTGRIIALQQQVDHSRPAAAEEAGELFKVNLDIIKEILVWNRKKVENLQEYELDRMQDTTAFFVSPEWQQPQYLISLSGYWLSWNGYYSSLYYDADDVLRNDLLNEALGGFSRTVIDFKEEAIVVRSLFGRALCYKEMRQYEKALQDLDAVSGRIKSDNDLFARCSYEKALISYLQGDFESALSRLKGLEEANRGKTSAAELEPVLRKLRVKIILAILEKQQDRQDKAVKRRYREVLHELKQLAEKDMREAGELYRFVNKYAAVLDDLTFGELGPVGSMALADLSFQRKQYAKTILRYKPLVSSKHPMIKKRKDEICFRLGYSFSRMGQWQEALSFFENLLKSFPDSSFSSKAACLRYVAAANHYKENPLKSTYARYIAAIKTYLQGCSDPRDKSEAHFQLGRYYLDAKKTQKANNEFALVEEDSPNYPEARYWVLNANAEQLESFNRKGLRRAQRAKKIYQKTLKLLEGYQNMVFKQSKMPGAKELEAHMLLLQAKLYTYGPEDTCSKALAKIKDFENRFSLEKFEDKLFVTIANLRMQCYQRLGLFKEAKEEITAFLKRGALNAQRWDFMNECGNRFYQEAKRLRLTDNNQASRQAEVALMIYARLRPIASKNRPYNRFYDSISLRMAEIYMDEDETIKAKEIYLQKLESDPASADAVYNLGLIQEKEGQWEKALETWRKFSKGFKTGSYYWFESRYRTAKVLNRLGKKDAACEMISITRVLHPELRDEAFKKKFIQMQREICGKG